MKTVWLIIILLAIILSLFRFSIETETIAKGDAMSGFMTEKKVFEVEFRW